MEKEIIKLFLEKIETLNERERTAIIHAIELINNPIFVTSTDKFKIKKL